MARTLLFILLALTSCSRGPQADLPSISNARSLAAEWALVNEQAAKGHLTGAFVSTMHRSVRQQLQSTAQSLTQPHASYAGEIAALLREPDGAQPAVLRAHAKHLKRIEDGLESA